MSNNEQKADLGFIGLAVMGQNLVLNMAEKGFKIAVFNRTQTVTDEFIKKNNNAQNVVATYSLSELVDKLVAPRKIMLMIKAGEAVDVFIQKLLPLLKDGDIIIDGGNSLYTDTERRVASLKEKGISYLGVGISGGEEGARFGPSIMPGGNIDAWHQVEKIFKSISAHVEDMPCCDWVGHGGAGHFVKMVHNGIEYADMQIICEIYDLLKRGLNLSEREIATLIKEWNTELLESYLLEITEAILQKTDVKGNSIVDSILDVSGQKGTGKWTGINAFSLGVPVTVIAEAVFARDLSAIKKEREKAALVLGCPLCDEKNITFSNDAYQKKELLIAAKQAMLASKIIAYAQGFMLMQKASQEYQWDLNYGNIAMLWRGGCIIRSAFLKDIKNAFDKNKNLDNLLLDDFFAKQMLDTQNGWRKIVIQALEWGIPMPTITSALAFYDGYRSSKLPANLIQAQRDYFGAHGYERTDKPRGEYFHTNWQN